MNTLLPIPRCQQQEIDAIQQQLYGTDNQHIVLPTVENEPNKRESRILQQKTCNKWQLMPIVVFFFPKYHAISET